MSFQPDLPPRTELRVGALQSARNRFPGEQSLHTPQGEQVNAQHALQTAYVHSLWRRLTYHQRDVEDLAQQLWAAELDQHGRSWGLMGEEYRDRAARYLAVLGLVYDEV